MTALGPGTAVVLFYEYGNHEEVLVADLRDIFVLLFYFIKKYRGKLCKQGVCNFPYLYIIFFFNMIINCFKKEIHEASLIFS